MMFTLSIIILSVTTASIISHYAECQYIEYHNADCVILIAMLRVVKWRSINKTHNSVSLYCVITLLLYLMSHFNCYADCWYVDCGYAKFVMLIMVMLSVGTLSFSASLA